MQCVNELPFLISRTNEMLEYSRGNKIVSDSEEVSMSRMSYPLQTSCEK